MNHDLAQCLEFNCLEEVLLATNSFPVCKGAIQSFGFIINLVVLGERFCCQTRMNKLSRNFPFESS